MTRRRMGGGSGRASAVTCGGERERELPLNYAGLFSTPTTNQPDGEGQAAISAPHCTSARCIKRSVGTLPQGSGLPPLPRCGLRLNKSVSPPLLTHFQPINVSPASQKLF